MIESAKPIASRPDVYRLALIGKLYAPEAEPLQECLSQAVADGAKHLLLDCTMLQQMDSTIMRAIIVGMKKLNEAGGGKVVFAGSNEYVTRILSLTRIDRYSVLAKDEAEALTLL